MARDLARERNKHGLFIFFDNLRLLLSTISSFEEAERCNNLLFEDIDQAADRLITAAETIQLVMPDIENSNDLTDVTSILNMTLVKVRNLSDQLQQFLVFTHVTSVLTTVAIRHVGAQTNALNREVTVSV